jgi:hypothetical protein
MVRFQGRRRGRPEGFRLASLQYLEGYFDDIVKNDDFSFCAVVETTSALSPSLWYCGLGASRFKNRRFPLVTDRKSTHVDCQKTALKFLFAIPVLAFWTATRLSLIDIKPEIKTGFPKVFSRLITRRKPGTGSEELSYRLYEVGMNKGATLSLQSLNPTVLMNITEEA